MGRFTAATMKWVCLLLIVSPAFVAGGTYEETRDVVDSAGKKFKCTYKLSYTKKAVSKGKSSVSCTPNKPGKTITETFVIEELGKSVSVKHTIKKGKESISAITMEDYVAPTGAPFEATHDCSCKMAPESLAGLSTSVRSSVPAVVNRQLPGGGLFSNLLANGAAPAPSPASNGLDLASLLGGGSSSNDLVTQLAMQVAQQQVDDFINNGGVEEAITNLVESGQLEEMATNFVESGQLETMMDEMMENVDMETMMTEMVGTLEKEMEESMQNGGPLGEMMESMNVTGDLEELMGQMENGGGLLGPEMLSQMGNMELNMKCSCSPAA